MKPFTYPSLSALTLLLGTLALAGCGGAASFSNPGSSTSPGDPVAPQVVTGPAISGTVYGGHAPVEGAHVYLLQPGTTGYGSLATSLLGSGTTTSPGGYPLTADTTDPNVPIGSEYVTTDSNGAFNLTGAYKCTFGQPVYIYAYGGNPGGTGLFNTNIVQLATLGNCPAVGNFSTAGDGQLQYVYLNEVSTVATAYTFQPFTLVTGNDAWHIGTPNHTQALLGIANAADTAAQLYDIQGATNISTSGDGEGHLANYRTQSNGVANTGNGVVPEATIDTLANILATCVDSVPGSVGTPTTQCTALFTIATNNGETTGPMPADTGTAAINIARFPAGNSSAGSGNVDATYASDIFNLQSGTLPYVPNLTTVPNDWTLAINYPYAQVGGYTTTNGDVERAESVQVDSLGKIWITAQAGGDGSTNPSPSADRWDHLGVYNTQNASTGDYIFGYVSVDSSNNAWSGNADKTSGIFYANSNGVFNTTYGAGLYTDAYAVVTDPAGDAYFFAKGAGTGSNYGMWEYEPGGTLSAGSPYSINGSTSTPTTVNLSISGATETNSGGSYTYNFAYTGDSGTTPLAVGNTVTLALTNATGADGNATGWQNLTTATVASVTGTTGFTATGAIPTTNSMAAQPLTITGATETNSGGSYTYKFAYTGDSGTSPLAVGNTVKLALTNATGADGNATGWQNLTTATVASVTGTTGFTATGMTATTNSMAAQPLNITGATETNSGGSYTYTFAYTGDSGTSPLVVGNTVTLALTNATGADGNATGWQNLTTATVASVNGTTGFTATGAIPTTNSQAAQPLTITAATETNSGGSYTYTFAYTGGSGTSPLAVGNTVTLALTNAGGTGTHPTAATGWGGLTTATVASVTGTTGFTATGAIATTNSSSSQAITITGASETNVTHSGVTTYTYTFTYTGGSATNPLAANDIVDLTTLNDTRGSTGWGSLANQNLTVVMATGTTNGTFTVSGTTPTTNGTGVGATGSGYYLYASNGATGSGSYPVSSNGATGSGSYPVSSNGAVGSGSYPVASNGATGTGSYTYSTSVATIPAGENVAHGSIDANGNFWLTTETSPYTIANVNSTGVAQFPSITVPLQRPEFPAIDGSNNAWIPIQTASGGSGGGGGEVYLVAPGGTSTILTSNSTGANFIYPFGAAVDGNGNVWITNRCGAYNNCVSKTPTGAYSTLVEINGTGANTPGTINTAISPSTNYIPQAQYPATGSLTRVMIDPLNIAIDPSGNIWITNYAGSIANGGQVVEIVGAAAPVVTPLSLAAGSNSLGAKP